MEEGLSEKKSGCGIIAAMFGRRGFWAKRSTAETGSHKSTLSNNTQASNNTAAPPAINIQFTKSPGTDLNPQRTQVSRDIQTTTVSRDVQQGKAEAVQNHRPVSKPSSNQYPNNHQLAGYANHRPYSNGGSGNDHQYAGSVQQQRKVPRGAVGISGELESMITDHQKSRGNNGSLVRASSSNVMLYGNLGNLKHPGPTGNYGNNLNPMSNVHTNSGVGYGERRMAAPENKSSDQSGSLCRAISTRMDPETLKIMGNEDYKNGNYAEALALYDAAIAIDPNKPAYRSNKSAALTALGRILEAIYECREAIRMEPHYHRAHHRLGNLYLRLGEVEKAIYHFKHSGPEADREDIAKAKTVQIHLTKCTEAKTRRDWNTLIKETDNAVSAGADSAPQVYALRAEAFLKTNRHQDADEAMLRSPDFNVEMATRYYGPIGYAGFLLVWAQVHMASGRFEEAVEAIQRAARLDGNNREVKMVMGRAEAVTAARAKGNELFRVGRFQEASAAYGEGLDIDPRNSVLLCNRAACRSKMGHFDIAVDDCTAALSLRPAYAKARLRRADCNAKLGRWKAAVDDYERLKREAATDDEEVERALSEAQEQLRRHGS